MKMKKIALAVAAVGMVFGVASVSAGELANEFNGLLSIGNSKAPGGASTSYGFGMLNYGHFFAPSVEGVVGVTYFSSTNYVTTGGVIGGNYYFTPIGKAGNVAFYAGATAGGSSGGGFSTTTLDGHVGLKYFVTDSAAVDVRYQHDDMKQSGTSGSTTRDTLMLGASAFF